MVWSVLWYVDFDCVAFQVCNVYLAYLPDVKSKSLSLALLLKFRPSVGECWGHVQVTL